MGRLDNKVCVVTGAGSRGPGWGNGKAVAVLFAREGATVVLNDRDADAVAETAAIIDSEGGTASTVIGDLTDAAVAERLSTHAVENHGRLDVLHNNVGIEGAGSVVDMTEELWDRVMAVNVKSMALACKYAVPAMAASGGGSIVNISSISALRPRGLTPYSASKGAVIALTRAMAVDHAVEGIRVNCVAPGPVYTPHVNSKGMDEHTRERRRNASLLKIEGTAWDVAYASLFFASDEARYITGVTMPVDGGVTSTSAAR
ncbi:SDR family NAD(P)-dependent oxidoreductase [Microbacterium sp. NPDC078428]|uniref:SDR family NAD(P)-dependent oxidoreductase n=1 Tax=Microbacterium sp. NPDC078428 TaxID=3364190 RepID=UPI0037C5D24E